ncbi:hypothetical protein VPHD479_0026 [Vibrio phage D479]
MNGTEFVNQVMMTSDDHSRVPRMMCDNGLELISEHDWNSNTYTFWFNGHSEKKVDLDTWNLEDAYYQLTGNTGTVEIIFE